jgi:hypothetical protein
MKPTSSPQQVSWGVTLGIVLQVVPPLLVLWYAELHPPTGEAAGWAGLAAPLFFAGGILSVGMWQVLTILPAALLFFSAGKHGVVRGLLRVGIFLALGNIAVLLWLYTIMHRATF